MTHDEVDRLLIDFLEAQRARAFAIVEGLDFSTATWPSARTPSDTPRAIRKLGIPL